jgi:hypothetical protein
MYRLSEEVVEAQVVTGGGVIIRYADTIVYAIDDGDDQRCRVVDSLN